MSSAILYLGIVLIWACVLIPRWLRREHSASSEAAAEDSASAPSPVEWEEDDRPVLDDTPAPVREPSAPGPSVPSVPGPERQRVLAARRRMLGMLIALLVAAAALSVLSLAAWWVVVPPTVMLLGYMLLLREAAHADAERAATVAARVARARTARGPVVAPPVVMPVVAPPPAEVIEFSASSSDESSDPGEEGLYDQYADARLRAVGD